MQRSGVVTCGEETREVEDPTPLGQEAGVATARIWSCMVFALSAAR